MSAWSPSNEEIFFLLRYIMGFRIMGNSKQHIKLCDGRHTVYVPNLPRSLIDDKKLSRELRPVFDDSASHIYLISHTLARRVRSWSEID